MAEQGFGGPSRRSGQAYQPLSAGSSSLHPPQRNARRGATSRREIIAEVPVPKLLDEQERDSALARVIAIVNDKGGVGKTSIAANLAGQFAGAGYRCLLIDLNRQANLADDLGYRGSDVDDQGAGLLGSVLAGIPLAPALDVRPQLDVVCGGARLEDLTPIMVSRLQHRGRKAFRVLGDVLAPIAADYEVVFIDCPPESTILSDLALATARWVLMPTKSDVGGLVGMTPCCGAVHPRPGDQPAARVARCDPVRHRHALARDSRRGTSGH